MMLYQSVVGPIGSRVRVLAVQDRMMELGRFQGAGVVVPRQSTKIVLLRGLVRLFGIRQPCFIPYPLALDTSEDPTPFANSQPSDVHIHTLDPNIFGPLGSSAQLSPAAPHNQALTFESTSNQHPVSRVVLS
jgi:hypothetical protein